MFLCEYGVGLKAGFRGIFVDDNSSILASSGDFDLLIELDTLGIEDRFEEKINCFGITGVSGFDVGDINGRILV